MSVTPQTTVAAALTEGPFGQLLAVTPQGEDPAGNAAVAAGMRAKLVLGAAPGNAGGQAEITTGLNVAGISAVAGAVSTYYGALSAAKAAQIGYAPVHIGQAGFIIPCHNQDVTSLAATLATVLDTSSNYGPAGT